MAKDDEFQFEGKPLRVPADIQIAVRELNRATNGGCLQAVEALKQIESGELVSGRNYRELYTALVTLCRTAGRKDNYWIYQKDKTPRQNIERLMNEMDIDWNIIGVLERANAQTSSYIMGRIVGERIVWVAALAGLGASVLVALLFVPKFTQQIEIDNPPKTSPVVVASGGINPNAQRDEFNKFLEKAKELGKSNDSELVVKIAAIQTIAEQNAKDIEHLKEVIGEKEPDEILRVVRLNDALKSLDKDVTANQARQDAITSELRSSISEIRNYLLTAIIALAGLVVTVAVAMIGPFIQDAWKKRHPDTTDEQNAIRNMFTINEPQE